jgi:hypothetical protein
MKSKLLMLAAVAALPYITSCNSSKKEGEDGADTTAAAAQPETEEWVALFDGKSLAGWHGFNKTGEVANWVIQDSALVCLGASKSDYGGDLVSDNQYDNFELTWDWKVDKGSNSGVMYHVIEDPKYKAPYETGPEYQIIDDIGYPGKLEGWQQAGADYAMTPSNDKKQLKPVGEWNNSRLIYNAGHVEHWLNGEKIVEFQAGTEEWKKKKTEGKWKEFPDYGISATGHIVLQDHGNKAYFKNIKIKAIQ